MEELEKIFYDNQKRINQDDGLCNNIQNFSRHIELYDRKDSIVFDMPIKSGSSPKIEKLRSTSTAKYLWDNKGINESKIAIVDFANHTHIGGGCRSGKRGQEEDLCRTSTLYNHISSKYANKYYTDKNVDIMYVPGVSITAEMVEGPDIEFLEDPFPVCVIVTAAPLLWFRHMLPLRIQYHIHFRRAIRIMKTAYKHNIDNLVTGAIGCGAFHNDPKAVAMAWADAVKIYGGNFKNIIFSIYEKPGNTELFETFSKYL